MNIKFGLIGTITYDLITFDSGKSFEGLGGVLYQAAVLCGIGEEVCLYTNLGEELSEDVEGVTRSWKSLRRHGIKRVSGPGNRVHLHYPERGERVEVLKAVVPPLNPARVIEDIKGLGMLILVINSGFDMQLSDWQKVLGKVSCPTWIDIHSLMLSRDLNKPRKYVHSDEWKEWVRNATFVQANGKEVASMLGLEDRMPVEEELIGFGKMLFEMGVNAVYITLGKEGALVMTPEKSEKLTSKGDKGVVDTTGCGDVFCSATAMGLASGKDPFSAARFGLELATEAVAVRGIEETYRMAVGFRKAGASK